MIFAEYDINQISNLLDSVPQRHENGFTWTIRNEELKDKLIFTLYTNVTSLNNTSDNLNSNLNDNLNSNLNDNLNANLETSNLISILTQMGTIELHNCTSYMLFEPDEVIFISSTSEKISSLIVGKKGTVSLFSNIERKLIGADFAELDTAFLMSAMQLALTESIIE